MYTQSNILVYASCGVDGGWVDDLLDHLGCIHDKTTASNISIICSLIQEAVSSFLLALFMCNSILYVICPSPICKNNNSVLNFSFLSDGPCFVGNHTKDGKMYFSIMTILTQLVIDFMFWLKLLESVQCA